MKYRVLLMLVMFVNSAAMASSELTALQRRELLVEAQADYDRGIEHLRSDPAVAKAAFQSAAQRFELASASGPPNGVLLYNLANAFLQSGDVGHAIVNYRRASRFIPGDARLHANLSHARTLVRSRIEPSGTRSLLNAVLSWHHRTSASTRWTLFIATYSAMWLALVLRMWRAIPALSVVAVVGAATSIILGISLGSDVFGWGRTSSGVVIADDVTVRKGNGAGFEPQFAQSLHSGTEFEVLEQRGEWLNVRLPDEKTGWIEARVVELIH